MRLYDLASIHYTRTKSQAKKLKTNLNESLTTAACVGIIKWNIKPGKPVILINAMGMLLMIMSRC